MTESKWWEDHANLVTLTEYLARIGEPAAEVAYAVEKPWKYEEAFAEARQAVD